MVLEANARWALGALRVFLGVFFLFEGLGKLSWWNDPAPLLVSLRNWHESGVAPSRWYLETIAIPGVPVFSRLVVLGELGAGLGLILGIGTRYVALAAFLMVLNFHFAHSRLFQYEFLSQGNGLPVLGGLLALVVGGARLPLSLKAFRPASPVSGVGARSPHAAPARRGDESAARVFGSSCARRGRGARRR